MFHHTRKDRSGCWTAAAVAHLAAAQFARIQRDIALQSAIAQYGDTQSTPISGCYAYHFPDSIKDQLRAYAREISIQHDFAVECWRRAGRRIATLRPLIQDFRRLPDGRVSYY